MISDKAHLSGFGLFTLWFGAAVSLAEIFTGGLIAPLGFSEGLKAILLGHLIGGFILLLGGVVGTHSKLPAMMSTRISFGRYGSYIFSILNVLQLVGWTAVMIISGARSANELSIALFSMDSLSVWAGILGVMIALWILLGRGGFEKLNVVAVVLLFALTGVLSYVVLREGTIFSIAPTHEMSFGAALELSVIMPLSWLPLIADYTRFAKQKTSGLVGSFLGYFLGSSLMYTIGLAIALYAKEASVATMMNALNLGFFALTIVILSTVTTTFLDAYSAGVTMTNIFPKWNEKKVAFLMTLLGLAIALYTPIEAYENFLYAIGSVFAPLFAVLLSDYFIFKKREIDGKLLLNFGTLLVWIVGIVLYYQFISMDLVFGSTLPTMFLTAILFTITKKGTVSWILKSN